LLIADEKLYVISCFGEIYSAYCTKIKQRGFGDDITATKDKDSICEKAQNMKFFIIIIVALAGITFSGITIWNKIAPNEKFNPKTAKVDIGEIIVNVNATGSVEPTGIVQVGAQVSGRVQKVNVQVDERVEKGKVLAVLDDELLQTERKAAEIRLEQAQSRLEQMREENESLELRRLRLQFDVDSRKIEIEKAAISLELAKKNWRRWEEMARAASVSETEADAKRLEKEQADRNVKQLELARDRLALDLRQIDSDRRTLAIRERQAKADVEQARQDLAKVETNLGYTTIISPISGVVLERLVEPGQTIAASFQTPNLFKIATDLKTIHIQAYMDEAEIGKIFVGQKVSFEVDSFKGETFTGVVVAVRLRSESRSNLVTYPVLIEAENPPTETHPHGKLRPGMTAYLTVEVERKTGVLRLPAAALRFVPPKDVAVEKAPELPKKDADDAETDKTAIQKGRRASAYQKGDAALKEIPIIVGVSSGDFYELLSGPLREGDEVIVGQANPAAEHPQNRPPPRRQY
jgi:HlyD family secretion protein